MNRTQLKTYAAKARRDFIRAMTDRAVVYGLTKDKIEPANEQGDVAIIAGKPYPTAVVAKRQLLVERIEQEGFDHVMEAMAYTWFNRLVAIRFMELHGYLDHGYRVLSAATDETRMKHGEDKDDLNSHPCSIRVSSVAAIPEILFHAEHVDLPGLDKNKVIALKLDGTKEAELYRLLLVAQCNALHSAMPFLFERIDHETELLLPDNLLHSDSVIRQLVNEIDEADWQEVEIIGWLYESYISERYEEVIGSVVASEDIPAATQRFTPKWVVQYLVQNTLGRLWLSTYPQSSLKEQMRYYIEPAEQTAEVQEQLRAITPTSLNPEEITFLDPACGSGHILVEAYDLFKAIYLERGYRAKDIPRLIVERNLFGLEIDDRAAQLAALAVMMKARADDRRIFPAGVQPHVHALVQTDGMDAGDIAAALNVPAYVEPAPPPGHLFETDDNLFTRAATATTATEKVSQADVASLITLFKDVKTVGSLVQVPPALATRLPQLEHRTKEVAAQRHTIYSRTAVGFTPIIEQARMLASQYDCVVANPPYMGGKYFVGPLKAFVTDHYTDAKADLYACFIQRNAMFAKPNGFAGMITIPNWMFLSSFEDVRKSLLDHQTIDSFVHNGRGVFGSDFGSCSFAFRNARLSKYRGSYRRLFEKQGSVATNEELEERFRWAKTYTPSNSDFSRIPASPIAYWVKGLGNFEAGTLASKAESGGRFKTHNDEKYVRYWWEISPAKGYWKRYLKGGEFRRFFGNEYNVADWRPPALESYESHGGLANPKYHQRDGVTCSKITAAISSFRVKRSICEYSSTSPTIFPKDKTNLQVVLAFLNSKVSDYYLAAINPSITTNVNDILALPDPLEILSLTDQAVVAEHAAHLTRFAQADWDSVEVSWDFQALTVQQHTSDSLKQSQEAADRTCQARFAQMKELEEKNNRLFIQAYGLQDELSPDVPNDQITLYRPDREEDIKRVGSYAVGCMMGRYSLDKPGLVYTHGGNVGFDPSQYRTFPADADGIVPLMETDWFPDDAANRFFEFIGVAWPKEHLDENLAFVAESLGPTKGEQPRDTIRRYLATGFFKHHLQMYRRRPIYWLFSSGKQRSFQCLVYLHRYHEGTLSRMRTEYVIPLQGKISARIDQLADDIAAASSTAFRSKCTKERDKLLKQQTELQAFDEKLRHYADLRVSLDLDDGVKVNYGKFGDLLAEVKAVTGGKDEE
jgi:hypothetical protein